MKVYNFKKMIGGWYIGNFSPSVFKTKKFEVSFKIHKKNEKWDYHYHKKATEINLIIDGKMKIQGKILKKNQIFVLKKKEIANPIFLKETKIICIKVPSVKNDKFVI